MKKTLTKIYLETTNICNLSCSFCHGTSRTKKTMTYDEFLTVLKKIRGKAKYLYFHLMGEPLLQPQLAEMAHAAHGAGFEVMLTTNGTLLPERGSFIFESGDIKKVSVSLQAADLKNGVPTQINGNSFEKYICETANFAKKCAQHEHEHEHGVVCVLRLWNQKSMEKAVKNGNPCESDPENDIILKRLHDLFPGKWIKNRSGYKLFDSPLGKNEVYLEFGESFEWPDETLAPAKNGSGKVSFCYALRDQIGILCDGTVVPCCLDADGAIPLGNIFENELDEILHCRRAEEMLRSFELGCPCEKLCISCGYAERFSRT